MFNSNKILEVVATTFVKSIEGIFETEVELLDEVVEAEEVELLDEVVEAEEVELLDAFEQPTINNDRNVDRINVLLFFIKFPHQKYYKRE
jgi:hypothetical protein